MGKAQTKHKIHYTKGYKYRLEKFYQRRTTVKPRKNIKLRWIHLLKSGLLRLFPGFASDGPSGTTKDRKTNMRPSFEHDAFFKLLRQRLLARKWIPTINRIFYRQLLADGMNKVSAKLYYLAVSKLATFATKPKNKKKIKVAP